MPCFISDYWRKHYGKLPLYKSGGKHIVANYRGIAKLSIIPKLFESLFSKDLTFIIQCIIPSKSSWLLSRKINLNKFC
uniref:Uncharacterized protein n=1 Tax=Megaselia scalaris TaxID=36166 RepID=T1GBF7_MEGSC